MGIKQKALARLRIMEKGGPGPGHFGHRGVPGHQGGSAPSGLFGRRSGEFVQAATSGVVHDSQPLPGGINEGEFLEYQGGAKGVWKKASTWESPNEVAAFEFDRLLGLGVVPPTVWGMNAKGIKGTSQFFIEGAIVGVSAELAGISIPATSADGLRIGILDSLLGNADRHSGNWLQRGDRLIAIDNGRIGVGEHIGVPAEGGGFGIRNVGKPIPGELLNQWKNISKDEYVGVLRNVRRPVGSSSTGPILGTPLWPANVEDSWSMFDRMRTTGVFG